MNAYINGFKLKMAQSDLLTDQFFSKMQSQGDGLNVNVSNCLCLLPGTPISPASDSLKFLSLSLTVQWTAPPQSNDKQLKANEVRNALVV